MPEGLWRSGPCPPSLSCTVPQPLKPLLFVVGSVRVVGGRVRGPPLLGRETGDPFPLRVPPFREEQLAKRCGSDGVTLVLPAGPCLFRTCAATCG